jgi:phosphotransferase system enzyme I (PtsI)
MMKSNQPKILSGKPAASGIGIGNAIVLETDSKSVMPGKVEEKETGDQIDKFERAKNSVLNDYEQIKTLPDNSDASDIIETQIQTLKDPEVDSQIRKKIRNERYKAEYAIFSVFNEYIQMLEATKVNWANERVVDIVAVRDSLIEAARDRKKKLNVQKGEVVFAKEIPPTVMVNLSHIGIGGVVIEKGGLTSHVVILSQSLGIPCVINAHWDRYKLQSGTPVIIDGTTGQVILNPTWKQSQEYEKRKNDEELRFQKARKWTREKSKTSCGHPFSLRANVEFAEELTNLEPNGAKGIGLLRTETILFETEDFNVDDQVIFYSNILQSTANESVTIRLFDAGGDKIIDDSEMESNPFLGWRGIRMLLDKKKLLRNQLEAIYRVSGKFKGRVQILIPMVSRVEEVIELKEHCDFVKKILDQKNVEYDENIQLGVMVEVPSVALTLDAFAQHIDFFSIGTNDLTQYTLAVDRGNERISELFDSFHPSVWKLIKMTYDSASRHQLPVSVCGEMASYPEAAACLMGIGIQDLSMNAGSIPMVKSVLCQNSLEDMQDLAKNVLSTNSLSEVHDFLNSWRTP